MKGFSILPSRRMVRAIKRVHRSLGSANLVEVAFVVPIILGSFLFSLEPLAIRHRVNLVRYQLEEVANQARSDDRLQADIWTPNIGNANLYDQYVSARAAIASSFSARLGLISGVTPKQIQHLDNTTAGQKWPAKMAVALLAPGTSAYIDDPGWSYADINHYGMCYKSASQAAGKVASGTQPRAITESCV